VLLALLVLPSLGALTAHFTYDDYHWIVDREAVHSLGGLAGTWAGGLVPGAGGANARPVTLTAWTLLWVLGRGRPWPFHLANVALAAAAVLLLHRLLLRLAVPPRAAFAAAALFALFPIHTEAVAAACGTSELLAAVASLASLAALLGGRRVAAVLLFAAALHAKESAVALPLLAAILLRAEGRRLREYWREGLAAGVLVAHALLVGLPGLGPQSPLDNPLAVAGWLPRVLTALWVQLLYLAKTLVPLRLSADYSYDQIAIVAGAGDLRAWLGPAALAAAVAACLRFPAARLPAALYAIPFVATANLVVPIGTIMGERLAYLPSAGVALAGGAALARSRRWPLLLLAAALAYGGRTWVRTADWHDTGSLTASLMRTAPRSARSPFLRGSWLAGEGRDEEAVELYDRSIAVYPWYLPAHYNRGNALLRLGRVEEAVASYRAVLALAPGHPKATRMLAALAAGEAVRPPARRYD